MRLSPSVCFGGLAGLTGHTNCISEPACLAPMAWDLLCRSPPCSYAPSRGQVVYLRGLIPARRVASQLHVCAGCLDVASMLPWQRRGWGWFLWLQHSASGPFCVCSVVCCFCCCIWLCSACILVHALLASTLQCVHAFPGLYAPFSPTNYTLVGCGLRGP